MRQADVITWLMLIVMLASIGWLKWSRWHKHYGEDPLKWHETAVILLFTASTATIITLGIVNR